MMGKAMRSAFRARGAIAARNMVTEMVAGMAAVMRARPALLLLPLRVPPKRGRAVFAINSWSKRPAGRS